MNMNDYQTQAMTLPEIATACESAGPRGAPVKGAYIVNRLRKYRRKKFKASDPQALLYWRYWFKAYGEHASLW